MPSLLSTVAASRFCGERVQRGRLEHVDAKAALGGCRIHRGELLFVRAAWSRRGENIWRICSGIAPSEARTCSRIGGILIDLRRGVDIDRRTAAATYAACQHRATTRIESCTTPSDCKSATIVHSRLLRAGCYRGAHGHVQVFDYVAGGFVHRDVARAAARPAAAKTVFDPLTQQLDSARDVQNTVDENADATRKAVDAQERGDSVSLDRLQRSMNPFDGLSRAWRWSVRKILGLWVEVTIKPDDAAAAIAARPRPVCYVLERESQTDLAVLDNVCAALEHARARSGAYSR